MRQRMKRMTQIVLRLQALKYSQQPMPMWDAAYTAAKPMRW
jgi:hypothetical protein